MNRELCHGDFIYTEKRGQYNKKITRVFIFESQVVCRELDMEGGNDEDISNYEQGTGVVWYSGVRCRGTEATLSACRMGDRPGENRCAHSRDVAVSCRQPTTPAPTTTTTPPPTTTAATSQGMIWFSEIGNEQNNKLSIKRGRSIEEAHCLISSSI